MKEWVCEELIALTVDGKPVSTMLHQLQELVRCKDCRHWNEEEHDCNIKAGHFTAPPDWFCADGKRR